ncbi:MAG TPA: NfeD family protein [Sphingomicrobium sp.]|jgi:inner membrane protein|nr:NfeD family protein [Sphingomicrobium sp.]
MSGFDLDPAWLWLIGGVVLLIAEVIAPGFFLIFIGAAAIITGVLAMVLGLPIPLQLGVFAILAFLSARLVGRRFYATRYDYSPDPFLNNKIGRLLGKVVVVVQAVDSHGGRVRVGDSEWSARGGPAAVGERVRIVDIDGNCLKVEPEHALPPA